MDMAKKKMSKKIRTTVVVTAAAEAILQKYRNNFGLKGPLSVGLMLFDSLTPQEQVDRTRQVEENDQDPEELLGLVRHTLSRIPEKAIDALTPSEAAVVRRYRQIVPAETAARADEAQAAAESASATRKRTARR